MKFLLNQYRRSFSGLPSQVWWLAAVMLVNRSGAMVMIFMTLYLTGRFGWSDAQAGQAIACYGLGSCLGTYLGGRLTQQFGARAIQLTSLCLTALAFVGLSFAGTEPQVLVALFLTSVAAESFRPANSVAIAEACKPSQVTRAFALNRLAINLGFTFGPAVGGVLATYSYAALFYVDAGTCVLAAVILYRFCGGVHGDRASIERHVDRDTRPVSNRNFTAFCLLSWLMSLVFFQLLSTYPLALKNVFGFGEFHIGSLMAVNTLLIVVFEMPLVEWLRQFRTIRCVAWGSLLLCEGFGLLAFGDDAWWAMLVVLTWTIGEMVAMPFIFTFITQTSTDENRASRLGWHATAMSVGFVMAPLVGTYLYELDPRLPWWIAMGVGPVVFLGFARLELRECEDPKQPSVVLSKDCPTHVDSIEPGI